MSDMSPEDLRRMLDLHRRWLNSEDGGQRANLYGANLDGANLDGANLYGANLVRANLYGQKIRYAACSWTDHGERGRTLRGVATPNESGELRLILCCGCFKGTAEELRTYIADGEERFRSSCTIALEFIVARMTEMGVQS